MQSSSEGFSGFTNSSGALQIQNTAVHTGSYALQAIGLASDSAYRTVPGTNLIYVQSWINIPTGLATNYHAWRFNDISNSTSAILAQISLQRQGSATLYDWQLNFWNDTSNSVNLYTNTTSFTLSTSSWYRIYEVVYLSSTGAGYVNVYANGVLVLSVTGLTNVNSGKISKISVGTDSASGGETTLTINYDDFMIDTVPINPYMPST